MHPNVAFKFIVANYGSVKFRLTENQILEKLLPHAGSVLLASISLLEILLVIEETAVAEDEIIGYFTRKDEVFYLR